MICLLASCNSLNTDDERVVVSYKGQELKVKDIKQYIPKDISPEDSLRIAKNYIQQWNLENVLVDYAKDEIDNLDDKIEFKVEEYRKKLIVYELREQIIKNNMNTVVSNNEISEYYKTNISQFIVNSNHYSYKYIKTKEKKIPDFKTMLPLNDLESKSKILLWCKKNADSYKLDGQYEDDLTLKKISYLLKANLENIDPESPVQVFTTYEDKVEYTHYFYMVNIIRSGKYLPLQARKDEIKKIILTNRKEKVINEFEQKLLENARSSNDFKF